MLNKLKSFRILAILIIIVFAGSCKTSKNTVSSVDDYKFENALLWEINGNGLDEPSYLFGTIHLIEAEDFYWPEATLGSFGKADKVVFEVDLDDMFDISSQLSLLTKAFMNDGYKLSDFYSENDYKEVKSHFEEMGIPMFFLERIKPMFLTVFASGDIDFAGGFGDESSVKSYEMELYEMAQDSKLEVEGLESLEFQMSVFDSIPYQEQADMLLESVRTSNTENDAFKVMTQMYVQQDMNAMIEA
ncbi:MAG: TraB/GumN family protein, partial [Saprospiraceae bacterium]|nr:TraB/GumN family protein [Saprospiraceae bacterium]